MSGGFPLAVGAAEMNAAAATYAPERMFEVARDLGQLRDVPIGVAMALRTITQRLQAEYPIHPHVVQLLFEIYKQLGGMVEICDQVAVVFRQVHAKDMEREENPRINEQAWDVG